MGTGVAEVCSLHCQRVLPTGGQKPPPLCRAAGVENKWRVLRVGGRIWCTRKGEGEDEESDGVEPGAGGRVGRTFPPVSERGR